MKSAMGDAGEYYTLYIVRVCIEKWEEVILLLGVCTSSFLVVLLFRVGYQIYPRSPSCPTPMSLASSTP